MICIFTHSVYGHSGNEIPAPCTNVVHYTIMSRNEESHDEFSNRMKIVGMEIRGQLKMKPVEPYSTSDGFDWKIIKQKNINLTEIMEA